MSTLLTWHRTTAAKTATTIAGLLNDIDSAITAQSANADFKWEVASKNTAATPFYLVLKRKDASAGRILIAHWSSAPAGVNTAIFDVTPSTTNVFIAWFPSGNVDTPSNLTAASGTILGDDTNCTKVVTMGVLTTIYAASFQPYVWDSTEAVWITLTNPASGSTIYAGGAGKIWVDKDDNEFDGVWGSGSDNFHSFGAVSPPTTWQAAAFNAGSTVGGGRSHKGANNRAYFTAYGRPGAWGDTTSFTDTVMHDGGTSKVYFDAILFLPQTKGVGPDLKFRQLAVGPPTAAAFSIYNTASLTPAAISSQSNATAAAGEPWFTNFKV
jgi:hypothetical protein